MEGGGRHYCQRLRIRWVALEESRSAPDDPRDRTRSDLTPVEAGRECQWETVVQSAGGATGEGLPRAPGGAAEVRYWTGLLSKRGARDLGRPQTLARSVRPPPHRDSSVDQWREKGMERACPGLRNKMVDHRKVWQTMVKGCGQVRVVVLKIR